MKTLLAINIFDRFDPGIILNTKELRLCFENNSLMKNVTVCVKYLNKNRKDYPCFALKCKRQ